MESTDRIAPPLPARLLSGLLCLLLAFEPIAANAQVVAASGAGRPTVEAAQNGVPLVQIVAPNSAGVSHNVYDRYSVDARGVVLNNSQVVVSTQQAGWIAGNPNLAGGSARIILNEVTGTSPSDLRGFTEVAGTKADVVIANPNGITCNGCGFINTSRGVLTTGTPIFGGSGSLDAFRVTGGSISIGANGMEGRYADQIDLLARSVSVQGPLRGNDINVVAGTNQVAYADLATTPIAGTGIAPTTAIDVANVGGMYANKIRLISTEAGVGVNSQGTLVALAGDFSLDAAGNISQGGVIAASDKLDIATPGAIANTGSLFGRDVTIQASNLSNSGRGVIAAGNSANLYVTDTLTNRDGALIYSGGSLAIAGAATRNAEGRLATRTAYLLNSSADILAEGDIEITATRIDNRRTTLRMRTDRTPSSTVLVQEMDSDWFRDGGDLVGRSFANGRTYLETVTVMVPNPDWPYDLVPTEVTRPVLMPYGYDYWHVDNAASIPTFSIQDLNQGGRRYSIVTERLSDVLEAASAEARILAGRDLYINADTLNIDASRTEAGRDLVAKVTHAPTVTGYVLSNRTQKTTWTGGCSDIQGDEAGWLGWCRSGWVWTSSIETSDRTQTASLPGTLYAARNFSLDGHTVSNIVKGADGLTPASINPSGVGNLGSPSAYLFGLPTGGLYTINPDGSSRYVVETDPRFTQFANFIGSDYMLGLLGLDPMATEKRLGDAWYEQQLVRDQLLKLRGKTDYRLGTTLNTEYQALLESGAEFARAFNLAPGVALTQAQVAALSRDIVWLETRKVAGQDVLVPVVYLGASYTPRSASALIGGGKSTTITATDINNQGGTISGDTVKLAATNDIVNESGTIAGQDVTLSAGRDIKVATATRAVEFAPGQTFTAEGEASRIEAQTLNIAAGNDLTLRGAEIKADTATLTAGRDLLVGSQAIATEQHVSGDSSTGGHSEYDRSAVSQRGSSLDMQGDLTLAAGNDLTVQGSEIRAGNDLQAYAGNNLNVVTARETDSLSHSAYSSTVSAKSQSNRDTGKASTLAAGNNLNLVAGNTFYAEGANLKAGQDANLQADTIVIASAHDTYSENSNYSNQGKRGSQQSQTQIQTDEATGSIVSAGNNLGITSTGDTIVEGSALAAGQQATIDVNGDLKLLAAQSSRYQDLFRSSQNSKEATELKYHEERVSQLLTTITVGSGADIQVGGNFIAAIAEKNEDGSFKADRMTVDGIVRGDSRQQVDVKYTEDGAGRKVSADGTPLLEQTSQVLGDLKSQGIRNGAKDEFTANQTQAGVEALQAYLQSGLIQVRNDPKIAAKLNRILRNSEGATLTYKDDSGKVSLTVAGQAKVQEVFNTLKVTETFDKKHFADQQTAMIVTLIVAIVLTICTAGAGAALIGAAQGTLAAAMANAAFIGMVSTMTGQLAAGADFDDAFETGVKAGVISAATAGIAYGAGQAVNSLNGVSPPAGTGETVSTVQSGSQTIEISRQAADTANNVNTANQTVEAVEKLKGLEKLTNSIWWEKTALNAVGQGAFAKARGGKFEDGFKGAMIGSVAASGAQAIGDHTTGNPFGNILGHAALGCAVASASRQDCGAGALGGAASASLARVIDGALPPQERLDGDGNVISEGMSKGTRDAIIAGGSIAGSALIANASGKDMLTSANAAANEVTNNYLDHREASKLAELENKKQSGRCDAACAQEIDSLKAEDARRNKELADCSGVSSATCDQARANVRQAAAEYVRVGKLTTDFTYNDERTETKSLALDSMGGVSAKDVATGYGQTMWDGVKATTSGLVTAGKALLGDEQAQQAVKDGAGAAWDVVKNPDNWPQLVGAMSDADRERLAQAYEKGDAKTIGEMMGVQVANFPVTGGGIGTVGKVGKIAGIAEDTARVAENAGKATKVAEDASKAGKVATGTVFDAIKATQPTYPGSVIPKSFEMALPNGQYVWVAGNATEHMAEFAQMKAVTSAPEAVRLASQEQLTSLQAAVNTATQNGIPYNQMLNVGGWELKFAPPRQSGQLPALIHALPR